MTVSGRMLKRANFSHYPMKINHNYYTRNFYKHHIQIRIVKFDRNPDIF